MRLPRLVALLGLACSLLTGPLWPESVAASPAVASIGSYPSIESPRQSLPTPTHDEATCAFCQAALFPPCVGHAPAVLPELAARVSRIVLSPDELILHFVSKSPATSRAPPTLSFA